MSATYITAEADRIKQKVVNMGWLAPKKVYIDMTDPLLLKIWSETFARSGLAVSWPTAGRGYAGGQPVY